MIDASKTNWVIDVVDTNFEQEVLERSRTTPVVVDFWAEWCGPCRQLGPLLEKMAADRNGAFVLAKVDVDAAQQIAMYFRIESIPAVLAFKDGQAVNGFVGLVPPEQLEEFINELAPGEPSPDDPFIQAVSFEETKPEEAEKLYRELLAKDDSDAKARAGLGRVLVALGKDEEAIDTLAQLGEHGEHGAEAVRLRRLIEMKQAAASAPDEEKLKKEIAAKPEDPHLRLSLGQTLATKERYQEALDQLLTAAELDRELGRGPVRELMVKIFEIIGVRSDMADEYRDKLRGLLY
jgi:putative thioredoxin